MEETPPPFRDRDYSRQFETIRDNSRQQRQLRNKYCWSRYIFKSSFYTLKRSIGMFSIGCKWLTKRWLSSSITNSNFFSLGRPAKREFETSRSPISHKLLRPNKDLVKLQFWLESRNITCNVSTVHIQQARSFKFDVWYFLNFLKNASFYSTHTFFNHICLDCKKCENEFCFRATNFRPTVLPATDLRTRFLTRRTREPPSAPAPTRPSRPTTATSRTKSLLSDTFD